MTTLQNLAINPWVIFASLAIGGLLGVYQPDLSLQLGVVGDVYVDLLKMIVLPFMVSAVIYSLQSLLRHGGAGALLKRACIVFILVLAAVAALGVATTLVSQGQSTPSASQVEAYGRMLGKDAASSDTVIELNGNTAEAPVDLATTLRASLVPTNIFAALAQGETLKALIFALLFGLAIGNVGGSSADGLARGLDAVYQACQRLTKWLNFPLPLVLVCMSAAQLAKTGLGPLESMLQFLAVFALASLIVTVVSVLVLWRRAGVSLSSTLQYLREPFALAVATRSSAACMPSMIDALSIGLRFKRERVELLVPLSISLLRIGPVLYYVCATMFIAHIYGRELSAGDLALVGAASVMAGCASAGMTGLVTVSLAGMVCGYLGLPFEAAFVLFLAVDPISDMLRTVVLVLGNAAAVALICDRPAPQTPADAMGEAINKARAAPNLPAIAGVNPAAMAKEIA
jgi:Na+/H+-dicarboxylate symporter